MVPTILYIGLNAPGSLAALCSKLGLKMATVADVSAATQFLCDNRVEMIFAELAEKLPELFTSLSAARLNCPVVAIGAAQPVQNAVKAIRLGAIEYLSTPLNEDMAQALLGKVAPQENTFNPIAGDPKTQDLLNQAKQFAGSNATVLLKGESGTGKEVFSQYIHANSPRHNGPFISVNCAAIPENLLESELFGHEKGAFSGALNKRIGKFQQADGGTLLLDEVSEMDLALQAKLLRAIQERVIDPVGANAPVPVDIRLVATTNRDLEDYVAEGNFREDLYFRLNVVALDILPLRERQGDILPLARHFAGIYGQENGLENITISQQAAEKLTSCYWKGNVRELENTVHRAVLMMGQVTQMEPEHIVISPMSLRAMEERGDAPTTVVSHANVNARTTTQAANPMANAAAGRYAAVDSGFKQGGVGVQTAVAPVGQSLQQMERELILNTLNYCAGNRQNAADILGISIRTLRNKLKEYETI